MLLWLCWFHNPSVALQGSKLSFLVWIHWSNFLYFDTWFQYQRIWYQCSLFSNVKSRLHRGFAVAKLIPSSRLNRIISAIHLTRSVRTPSCSIRAVHPYFLDYRTFSPRRPHSSNTQNTHLLLWSAVWSWSRDVRYDVWGRYVQVERTAAQRHSPLCSHRPCPGFYLPSDKVGTSMTRPLLWWSPYHPPAPPAPLAVAKTPTWGRGLTASGGSSRHTVGKSRKMMQFTQPKFI